MLRRNKKSFSKLSDLQLLSTCEVKLKPRLTFTLFEDRLSLQKVSLELAANILLYLAGSRFHKTRLQTSTYHELP